MDRIDVLVKQLEIAHKRDEQLGGLIMLVKGWSLTLFLGIIVAYSEFVCPLQSAAYARLSVSVFVLLWVIEALMGAYQTPYYEKRDEIQKSIQEELRGSPNSRNLVFLPYNEGANRSLEVVKDLAKCFFHLSVGLFYIAIISMLFWLYNQLSCGWILLCISYVVVAVLMYKFS